MLVVEAYWLFKPVAGQKHWVINFLLPNLAYRNMKYFLVIHKGVLHWITNLIIMPLQTTLTNDN